MPRGHSPDRTVSPDRRYNKRRRTSLEGRGSPGGPLENQAQPYGAENMNKPPPSEVDDVDDAMLVREIAAGNRDALLRLHPLILESVLTNNEEILETVDLALVEVLRRCPSEILEDVLRMRGSSPEPEDVLRMRGGSPEPEDVLRMRGRSPEPEDVLRMRGRSPEPEDVLRMRGRNPEPEDVLRMCGRSPEAEDVLRMRGRSPDHELELEPEALNKLHDYADCVTMLEHGAKEALLLVDPLLLRAVRTFNKEFLVTADQRMVEALLKFTSLDIEDALQELEHREILQGGPVRDSETILGGTSPDPRLAGLQDGRLSALYELDPLILEGFLRQDMGILSRVEPVIVDCLERFLPVEVENIWRIRTNQNNRRSPSPSTPTFSGLERSTNRNSPVPDRYSNVGRSQNRSPIRDRYSSSERSSDRGSPGPDRYSSSRGQSSRRSSSPRRDSNRERSSCRRSKSPDRRSNREDSSRRRRSPSSHDRNSNREGSSRDRDRDRDRSSKRPRTSDESYRKNRR